MHNQLVLDLRRKIKSMLANRGVGRGDKNAAEELLKTVLNVLAGRTKSRSISAELRVVDRQLNRLAPDERTDVLRELAETFPLEAYS